MSAIRKVIIIGSGPAGYTAAVYAARAKLEPLMFAGEKSGGQLMLTTEVENFPGFVKGINGPELMTNMQQQAERFGTEVVYRNVNRVDFSDPEVKKVYVSTRAGEEEYQAKSIIISTGAQSITLGLPGEEKLYGRGVSTCAVCDAAFFKDKTTFVVGGGDSAMEDAMALTKFAQSVTIIHRRDAFRASKIMQERVLQHPKISVLWNSSVVEVIGDQKLTHVKIVTDGKEQTLPADGVFLAIGHRPMTSLFEGIITLDPHGYVVTRQSASEKGVELAQQSLQNGLVQFPSMTSVDGVFAAGDVVDVRYKQAITAAGQGCAAALDVERWLERHE